MGAPLAEGGFGVVMRARHPARGEVALKILHPELAPRLDLVRRFEREVEAIRRVDHPNVIRVYEHGCLADGRPYFAMELLTGESLDRRLAARGALPADEVLAVLAPLCDALEAAHARAIVHRDIKPSNIFIAEQDGRSRVVLLDFGIAKLLDADGPALTEARQVLGTPSCLSPEQIRGEPVDARTDVYALGALLYTLLTGAPPFDASSYPALRSLHLFATPPRPSSRAAVSPAFDRVVLRAMSKDPAARQPSAAAFLAELRAAAASPLGKAAPSRAVPAFGVYLTALADPGALEAPDEALLSDLEALIPLAIRELAAAGFSPVLEIGPSVLLATALPEAPGPCAEARRAAISAARALHGALARRPGRDRRLHPRLCLHAGELVMGEGGAPVGGSLLDLPAWVPASAGPGLFATPAAIAGLDIPAPGGWIEPEDLGRA